MPQAIKYFSGTAVTGSTTVYTCPANTTALIIPTVSFSASSGGSWCLAYNTSSVASDSVYNIRTEGQTWLTARDKYSSVISYGSGGGSIHKAHPDAEYMLISDLPGYNSISSTTMATFDHTAYLVGPLAMGAGHKLSLYSSNGSEKTGYSFTIIEEAAS